MFRALFTGRRLLATLVVILGFFALCGLGFWQLSRSSERQAINERITSRVSGPAVELNGGPVDPEELDYRRVTVRGQFDPSQEVVLRNRSFNGTTGVHVLTPLRISGSDAAVLVDRGWLPMEGSSREERQAYAPPAGEVTVEGVARRSQHQLGGPSDPPLQPGETRRDAWFRADIPAIERQVGYRLLPVFVEQQPASATDLQLPIRTATTDLGPGSHLSYAIQWFSFGAILVVGYIVLIYQQLYGDQSGR